MQTLHELVQHDEVGSELGEMLERQAHSAMEVSFDDRREELEMLALLAAETCRVGHVPILGARAEQVLTDR